MITEQQEIKLWRWLKRKLSKDQVDFQRIENTTGGGVPDVNACCRGREAWIEPKVYTRGNVVLRKEQYAWIVRRGYHDGNVMVLAHNPDDDAIEIFMPPFGVRVWGGTGKYVAITSNADFEYSKKTPNGLLISAIFGD